MPSRSRMRRALSNRFDSELRTRPALGLTINKALRICSVTRWFVESSRPVARIVGVQHCIIRRDCDSHLFRGPMPSKATSQEDSKRREKIAKLREDIRQHEYRYYGLD